VIRDPGAEDNVRQALEMGADVVGGIPWIEYTDEDAGDPGLRMLEMLAVNNMLEVAFLASHLLWMTTTAAARVLSIPGFGLAVGNRAHLVVLRGQTVAEVLTDHAPPLHVIKDGRVVILRED